MRLLRLGVLWFAGFAVLALVAVWQLPGLFDWDHYRGAVESVVSAGLGRPVRIAGPIRLSLLPQATLRAGDVSIADTGDGADATVGELRIRVALGALLTGRVEAQDLVLQDARMRLPWPLAGFTLRGAPLPAALHARVEGGTLLIGGLAVADISGDLSAGAADQAFSASGLATVLGRRWRMTGRLGRAGSDGAATIAISLDGLGPGVGTGGALTGQVAPDGAVAGRITARGPDLSLLLPAPAQAWSADGRLAAGSGLVVADEMELTIGGSPAQGAVALRLLPALRLDGALAANRLDLDAWLPPLLHGGPVALPTGIDLSAESAPLAGGTLRRLRAGFELSGDTVTLRESEAVLPGEAALTLAGALTGGHFRGNATITAPDLPHTLAWLRPQAAALIDVLPPDAFHAAHLAAHIQADGNSLAFGGLAGDVDGVPVTGDVAIRRGPRMALAATLTVSGPALDRWLPDAPRDPAQVAGLVAALPRRLAALDSDVTLTAVHPVWHERTLDRLVVEGGSHAGVLAVRHVELTAPDLTANLSGTVDGDGRIGDGLAVVRLGHADAVGEWLPAAWHFAPPMLSGPAMVEAAVAGPASAWGTHVKMELADVRLQADGVWNGPGARWAGSVAVHHPGAPRLLAGLGLPGVASWLGDGSLSAAATVEATARRLALSGLQVSAGGLQSSGELVLARPEGAPPRLTGALEIDTLPVPLPRPQSADPLMLGALRAGDAQVSVHAAHLLWGAAPGGEAASARIELDGGVLRLNDIAAHVAGGTLAGQVSLDASGAPRLAATLSLTGAVLDGPAFATPVDVIAGVADAAAEVTASGYSPAALLASLQGAVRLGVRNGALAGIDLGQVLTLLQAVPVGATPAAPLQQGLTGALKQGATPFSQLTAAGTLSHGLLTLADGTMASPAATGVFTGSVDFPNRSVDLRLTAQPALDGAPAIGLRLIGPAANPSRTPGFTDLARWLATR